MPVASKARTVDALLAGTLKHLRDEWWDDAFTAFLVERLRPRAGNRILDVGCGTGAAELRLSRLRVSQVTLVGVDLVAERTITAERTADAHNLRASFAAGDACHLPFPDGSFDSTFCVAVLQHIPEPGGALREFVRVTRPGGRVVAVEPDNAARYWYSDSAEGIAAFEASQRFFAAAARDAWEPRVGPRLPSLFAAAGLETLGVQLFPVAVTRLGAPDASVWAARRTNVEDQIAAARDPEAVRLGREFLAALERYEASASAAGTGFVEIQSTLLFGVVGQRPD